MKPRSAYQILGVPETATAAEIRLAYRRLAKTEHPDLHGGSADAHQRFLEITAAHAALADPVRRAEYDRDPEGTLQSTLDGLRRAAQLERRRRRLRKLYQ